MPSESSTAVNRAADTASAIAQFENLRVEFETRDGTIVGVEDISFHINPGETVCVVGETGSGKSVSSLSMMRLVEFGGGRVASGQLIFNRAEGGKINVAEADQSLMCSIRGNEIGMIFQEPMTALNPVMTIGDQIDEIFRFHVSMTPEERQKRALGLLEDVNLPDPERIMSAYPHELSGGQRQRSMIAMALALGPKILIADEPTTALDVTTQAQILRLIKDMQRRLGTGVLFITHDFGVVADIADRVIVMQEGLIVESGTSTQVLNKPKHKPT